jgi:hypothetical protein
MGTVWAIARFVGPPIVIAIIHGLVARAERDPDDAKAHCPLRLALRATVAAVA